MTPAEAAPKCAVCGKPATCFGAYETNDALDEFACDDCCGHGNEDGHCEPVPEALAASPHGKDAGEEPVYKCCDLCAESGGGLFVCDDCLEECDATAARLTEAEGLLREWTAKIAVRQLMGDEAIQEADAFLKKPPEGST